MNVPLALSKELCNCKRSQIALDLCLDARDKKINENNFAGRLIFNLN